MWKIQNSKVQERLVEDLHKGYEGEMSRDRGFDFELCLDLSKRLKEEKEKLKWIKKLIGET